MRKYQYIVIAVFCILSISGFSQDLLEMLEQEASKDAKPDYTTATFKSTRLINGHTIENVAAGVLDFRISHRFGYLNTGIKEFYGLDQATIRLGLDYGLTNWWMVGIGRSSFQKQLDGFTKFKLLRQANGHFPVTVSWVSTIMYKTAPFNDPLRINYNTSRLYYSNQLLVGRKFSESVSLQLIPTHIHYNLAETPNTNNEVFAMGIGGRVKLSKRVSLNAEYYYQLPTYQLEGTHNSLAIGFDIETGGHVFQLHFTNSTGMTERTFISETTGDFFQGDIHFGFNISRVFTIKDPRK
ncbi:MAG: DUF5777 family beta-barrel protein [Cyclobacteriaceae bacterium]